MLRLTRDDGFSITLPRGASTWCSVVEETIGLWFEIPNDRAKENEAIAPLLGHGVTLEVRDGAGEILKAYGLFKRDAKGVCLGDRTQGGYTYYVIDPIKAVLEDKI